jgi:hypothetical protein
LPVPDEFDPPLPLPPLPLPPPVALDAALAMSEAVLFTVLTTLLITLRAVDSAPPFFEPPLRFFDDAFFAGALAGAFFDAALFAGAFFEAFFAGAFFEEAEAFFAGAFFEAFLLAPPFFDDFFEGADFFAADFFDADFFDDFLAGAFFADFFEDFLAAMDSSPISKQIRWGAVRSKEKKLCCVATALHEFQCRRRCRDCHARNDSRAGLQPSQSSSSSSAKRSASTSSSSTAGSRASS